MVYLLMAAVLLMAPRAPAQATVYKCVQDGKISYGSVPCAGGAALPAVEPGNASSNTSRLKALGEQMERERHRREAEEERQRQRADAKRLQCDKQRLRKKWSDEDAAAASASARAKAQRHARRQAETLALECG